MALLNHNAVLTTALFYKNFILNISRSTKPAPLFWDLFGITGQFRPFPASWCVLPHPLQNRVPRVQVLLPLPIHLSPGLAKTAWPGAFSSLCDPGHGLSIPSSCCIRCCPLTSARNRFLPPFSPPAPGTHPVSPFSGFSGCVSLFLPSFDLQNFRLCFCASCRIAFTD